MGIVAVPLAMALAISSGVPPQFGLYTAITAGIVIPLLGGSRFSVSGPTAAFVVVLLPVANAYGLAGLLTAGLMAGAILIMMALLRLGRFIEYIPRAVTLGFTAGIAMVIAVLQVDDLLGLSIQGPTDHISERLVALVSAVDEVDLATAIVGLLSLTVMMGWPRLNTRLPAHLVALLLGVILGWLLPQYGFDLATIGNSFEYTGENGELVPGIPSSLPEFDWPWKRSLEGDKPFELNWQAFQDLLGAAFAIAMLAAIESLLCAVVLDRMSGTKHSANSELLGQGIGNLLAPFFGGITATAAIARSATNFRSGAVTPLAAVIHAIVVLLAMVTLAPLLNFLPMASMAALLLIVAWQMSDIGEAKRLVTSSPVGDIMVFIVCLALTVFMDMVVAIIVGVLLASVFFMRQMAEATILVPLENREMEIGKKLPPDWEGYSVEGPLFFAAADRIFGELSLKTQNSAGVILSLKGVSLLDDGGLAAFEKYLANCKKQSRKIHICDFQFQPLKALARSGFQPDNETTFTYSSLVEAKKSAMAFD